jgi:aspartyl-tRNA(Asn)/glutamyl-tRNA(Gln) amidotransferase subunit C
MSPPADVEKVSLLGRLLSDAELDKMTEQMGRIVGIEQLGELNTETSSRWLRVGDAQRLADDALPPAFREAALANAPKKDAECYRVPAVLGE